MTLILDTDRNILIAESAAELAQHLIQLLPDSPTDSMLAKLAATVLECDQMDIIITRSQPENETALY